MGELKYVLTEEDVNKLPNQSRYAYLQFWDLVSHQGVIYIKNLKEFDEILHDQFMKGVLFNNGLERYPEIFSENIRIVINKIVEVRNKLVNKGYSNTYDIRGIYEGVKVLKKFVEEKFGNMSYKQNVSIMSLYNIIEQLEKQLSLDARYFENFDNERKNAIANYNAKKAQYDSLSLFGKFTSIINGKRKELEELKKNYIYYISEKVKDGIQPGDIFNPEAYDDYLKQHNDSQGMVR